MTYNHSGLMGRKGVLNDGMEIGCCNARSQQG